MNIFGYVVSKDILDNIANIFTIIVSVATIASLVIALFRNLFYQYKLRRLAVLKRPDWLSEEEFYNHTHNYIKTRVVSLKGDKFSFRGFTNRVLVKSKKQYHLILGESGSGKSTFLINLYARFECRKFKRGYLIKCISLKMPDAIDQICKIENQKQIILLLDAFDEAHGANVNAVEFLKEIEESTKYFAKVIITSRNNFFDDDDSVPVEVNITRVLQLNKDRYDRYYIQPFTICNVIIYIMKKYKFLFWKTIKSLKVISKCKDVVCRPLILNYIDLLINDKILYRNSSDIYKHIIFNWIRRETYFICSQNLAFNHSLIQEQMCALINDVAIYMYKNYPFQQDYYIKVENLAMLNNNQLLENTDGKRNRSLFDRVNDKLFFAHKSILEYLLVENFDKLSFRFEPHLDIMYGFMKEMSDTNRDSKYRALFYVNYNDNVLGNSAKQNDSNTLIFESTVSFIDRKTVKDMVLWYYAAIQLPIIIDKKVYDRSNIRFKVNDKIIYYMRQKENDQEKLVDKIMQIIKMNFYQMEIQYLTITTYCVLRDTYNLLK